jgi:hypothetical protein
VEGRKSADEFLTSHGTEIGSKSSSDFDVLLAEWHLEEFPFGVEL